MLTSMRSIADLHASRSCDEGHWHRPVTETEPWRPLTENEKTVWDALCTKQREVCDALVHRLHRELGHSDIRGMVDSLRQNRAHPTVLAAAKLMQCKACQGECQIDVSSGVQWEDHGTWSSSADGQFLLEAPHKGDTCQRLIVGGRIFESSCGPDLANCFPSRASWKCLIVGSETDAARIVVQVRWTSRDSHDRPGGMLQRPFISGMGGFEKREMGSATS